MNRDEQLKNRTSLQDLTDIMFFMGISDESFRQVKSQYTEDMMSYLRSTGRINEFWDRVKAEKPWVLR